MPAEHDIARDRFVEARGFEAVGAGQIEHAVSAAADGADEAAFLALDGDAGVVRDLLAAAGQPVEQRGLAAVGIADQREAEAVRRAGAWRSSSSAGGAMSTQTVSTSRRRRANVVSPTRTTNGSPPGRACVEHLDALAAHEAELDQPPLERA